MKFPQRNLLFIFFSVLLLSLLAGSIRSVIEFALDPDNMAASHLVLIPFISAALIYLKRNDIFRHVAYSPLPGALLMMLGAGLFIASRTIGTQFAEGDQLALEMSSIIAVWLGGFLSFYGTAAFRAALFPLLFLVFCIPIPSPLLDRTIAVLQHASAETAFTILKLTGTPVFREGYVFAMPNLVIEVAPECSGIRSGISMFILNLVAGQLLLQSPWKRAVLVIAAIPIQIVKNAVRIDTLSLLTIHVDPGIIEGRLHHEGGIVFFMLGLLLVYPILVTLMKSERKRALLLPRTAEQVSS
jgi:exosortase